MTLQLSLIFTESSNFEVIDDNVIVSLMVAVILSPFSNALELEVWSFFKITDIKENSSSLIHFLNCNSRWFKKGDQI